MKNIISALILVVSLSAVADSGSTIITTKSSNQSLEAILIARNDVGQCMGDCASEQGMCIASCQGDGQCIANCAAAHGRCVARCN